ncbi:glycoside hydrolase family 19 protein [Haemophilus parainfluenzae]|jgi:putative chitinase|uniref:glycoside hydrolase family 19 protein n=1 Tax=Haemophilus parainfluenzae TaxID=729 RepID=UPI000DAF2FDC|nr:glycoside hydrolase family 19 protein [Haemophilus parainfluenzae]RDE78307.1 glycoside hydrolase family 19 protein [Haemophilus parainfluenzae]DAX78729.1 MAG TPA: Chitinase A [Caudoviricetes sp.]
MMHISQTTFNKIFPNAIAGIYKAISDNIEKAGCITKAQQAMFIAQCGHETRGFTRFCESMNYSVAGLRETFRKYFTLAQAQKYGYVKNKAGAVIQKADQVSIANIAYANRMGNGNQATGDGWKYRGRGLPHLTGKDNYLRFQKWLGKSIMPEEVSTDLDLIVKSGVWFWLDKDLANCTSVEKATLRVNGGTNGLEERCKLYRDLMVS